MIWKGNTNYYLANHESTAGLFYTMSWFKTKIFFVTFECFKFFIVSSYIGNKLQKLCSIWALCSIECKVLKYTTTKFFCGVISRVLYERFNLKELTNVRFTFIYSAGFLTQTFHHCHNSARNGFVTLTTVVRPTKPPLHHALMEDCCQYREMFQCVLQKKLCSGSVEACNVFC